jgi:peptidyl-prolyl cis-trans isomerase SurA
LSLLKPAYADALRPLKANQATPPMRNDQNMNVLFVCDRQLAGENAVTRDQIQSSLVSERTAMLGKRYLRQIRAGATIENHQ